MVPQRLGTPALIYSVQDCQISDLSNGTEDPAPPSTHQCPYTPAAALCSSHNRFHALRPHLRLPHPLLLLHFAQPLLTTPLAFWAIGGICPETGHSRPEARPHTASIANGPSTQKGLGDHRIGRKVGRGMVSNNGVCVLIKFTLAILKLKCTGLG